MPTPSVTALIDRVVMDSAGRAFTVTDIKVDLCTGQLDIDLTPDSSADLPAVTINSFCGWSVPLRDVTPEEVAAQQAAVVATEPDTATGTAVPPQAAQTRPSTPFSPENILLIDGRWFHDGVDVTERPVAWRCTFGHSWWETLAIRTSPQDTGCPHCPPRRPRKVGAQAKKRRNKR